GGERIHLGVGEQNRRSRAGKRRDEPTEEQRSRGCPRQLGGDEAGHIGESNARERIAGGSRQRYRGVCERRGAREPVSRRDVRAHGKRNRMSPESYASPNHRKQSE